MRVPWIALLVLLTAPVASAHGGEDETNLFVEAHDDDGFYFLIEGYEGKNPGIVLEPGVTYNVTLTNRGSTPHNFRVSDANGFATPLIDPGETTRLEFTVPTSGLDSYWCDPHRSLGMEGNVVATSEDLEKDTPGFPIALVFASLAIVMMNRRRS